MAPPDEKVTVMILNVDLKCPCCYKKVKKLLCKFPQIRDQVFYEDKNKVRITVVCCNPEKVRDKLCCKGGKAIQSIEILEPTKPPPPPPPKVDPPPPPPPKVDPPPPPPPKVDPPPPPKVDPPPPKVDPPPPPKVDPPPPPKIDPPPPPNPSYPVPFSACCQECYQGRSGGPCHDFGYNYGRPVPLPPGPCYDGYGYQYGGNRGCYVSRCDYFSEENPQGCSIM